MTDLPDVIRNHMIAHKQSTSAFAHCGSNSGRNVLASFEYLRSSYCTMVGGKVELGDVTHHNIKQLKRLNQVVFPVTYNDKFYKDVLEVGELAKLAYFNDIVVGAVCCHEDRTDGQRRLYIMTLGCLAPYRRLGIGSAMLLHVLGICERDGNYDSIYLHVQINNEEALNFYSKFGFTILEKKENYYKRIEPADAYVLQKTLEKTAQTNGKVEKKTR